MCEDGGNIVERKPTVNLARIKRSRLRRPLTVRAAIPSAARLSGGCAPTPTSPTPGVHMPNFVYQLHNPEYQTSNSEWYKYRTPFQTKRDNLMEIAMRTVMLMRQNQQLQQKLAALQAETRVFMRSMAQDRQQQNQPNPEPPQQANVPKNEPAAQNCD